MGRAGQGRMGLGGVVAGSLHAGSWRVAWIPGLDGSLECVT